MTTSLLFVGAGAPVFHILPCDATGRTIKGRKKERRDWGWEKESRKKREKETKKTKKGKKKKKKSKTNRRKEGRNELKKKERIP